MPKFSERSNNNLITCDFRLVALFREVIKHRDCTIICGHRGEEAQTEAFRTGKSKAQWGESNHNTMPSKAVDVMPYPIDWDDLDGLREFAGFVFGIAAMQGISVKWGGHFKSFFDGPHWEIGN